ncbi:queuosine-tRNA galactosyltransferase-like isoform X2 [Palaemon carinicauda]|uniref:queuosine-tRNA galactosyltransferase-like isoform X2 n=1 Tax=Palaemon carinicauda TaxID=392227 RepID=UPI0035B5E8B5
MSEDIDVSVIIPIHNAGLWLDECLDSLYRQKHTLNVEVSIFLDSCTDNSLAIVDGWAPRLKDTGYIVNVSKEDNETPKGVGYAKNKAVVQSHGKYLCFLDSDDTMMPERIQKQYDLAYLNNNAIVGCRFKRDPPDSTARYTKWANEMSKKQLNIQIYTSHGPTVIMPTWFCHRNIFDSVGGFSEDGKGTPEDLIFFHKHISNGGKIIRHDDELLIYRQTIWDIRIQELQRKVLKNWNTFTIWNAGKQGRKFYRSLTRENQKKVSAFCDVDVKKVGSYYTYEETKEIPKPKVPIIHFSEAKAPLIICMKMELTGGQFEENLKSLQLEEGKDYHHFN